MKSLSKTANQAFAGRLQTAHPDDCQECLEDDEVEEQINNNDDDDDIPKVGEVKVHQIIQRLTWQLFNIQENQLSVTTTGVHDKHNQRNLPAGRRPCHCTVLALQDDREASCEVCCLKCVSSSLHVLCFAKIICELK